MPLEPLALVVVDKFSDGIESCRFAVQLAGALATVICIVYVNAPPEYVDEVHSCDV